MGLNRSGHSASVEVIVGAVAGAVLIGLIAAGGSAWRPMSSGNTEMAGLLSFPSPKADQPAPGSASQPDTSATLTAQTPPATSPPAKSPAHPPLVPDLHSASPAGPASAERSAWTNAQPRGRDVEESPWPQADTRRTPPAANLNSPGFRRAAEAAEKSDPSAAIVIIEDFRAANPDPLYAPHLDALGETALDRLYWQRVRQLIDQRQQVSRQISELRVEHSRATDPDRRRSVAEQIEQLRTRLNHIATGIQAMGYSGTSTPEPGNPQQIARLREQRDRYQYETWKYRVRLTLIRTRGTPPWGL